MKRSTVDLVLRSIVAVFYFAIFFLAMYAPIIQHFEGYPAGENIYALFSPVCHQYPTRCFWIFERPWALCARCSSAYLGLALAALIIKPKLSFFKRVALGISLVAIAAIDPIFQLLGFYESSNFTRLLTGLLGGAGVFLAIYPIPLRYRETTP